MKVFFYSSPYRYYRDNLYPLACYFRRRQHEVIASYSLSPDGPEFDMMAASNSKASWKFFGKEINPDLVFLTQPYWYKDLEIALECQKRKIPLYVIDHAPPMMRYTERHGKRSHLYRAQNYNIKTYFTYGITTIDIMREVGYPGKLEAVGSTRIENMVRMAKKQAIKPGYVLFDTSNKMEDKGTVKKFIKFMKNKPDETFIIREHSRSPQLFRQACEYPNVRLENDCPEEDLYQYSNFIFSFPSSAMLTPALLNRKIYALYESHFCLEAQKYFQKYTECIFRLGEEKQVPNYQRFISNNISYSSSENTEERIYRQLEVEGMIR